MLKNMQEVLEYGFDERYEEGVVHIDPKFIKMASEDNKLELLARENSRAVLGSDLNIYMKVKQ